MDKDLVKMLRCLESYEGGKECFGDGRNKQFRRMVVSCGESLDKDMICCPYSQEKYKYIENGEFFLIFKKSAEAIEDMNTRLDELKTRMKKYEESQTPSFEDVYLSETKGKRLICIQDVMKIIDEIFRVRD